MALKLPRSKGQTAGTVSRYCILLGMTASVTLGYQGCNPDIGAADHAEPGVAGSKEVGRTAALLLLPYYLPAEPWALKRDRRKYLAYAAPFQQPCVQH
jgi:hypothetical protein